MIIKTGLCTEYQTKTPGLASKPTSAFSLFVWIVVHQGCETLCCGGYSLMDGLMAVCLPDGLGDQSSQLALGYVAFMEYQAADDDAVDGIHLRQAAIDLLLKDPVGHSLLHAGRIGDFFTDALQRVHGNGIATTAIGTIGTVTKTYVPCRCVALTGPLEALTLLPEGAHDVAEFFVGQRCPGRIARQIIGLPSTGIGLV